MEHRAHRWILPSGKIRVPQLLGVERDLAGPEFQYIDFGVVLQLAEGRLRCELRLTETGCESDQGVLCEILLVEKNDLVREERIVDIVELRRTERLRQVDAEDLGADRGSDRIDLDRRICRHVGEYGGRCSFSHRAFFHNRTG